MCPHCPRQTPATGQTPPPQERCGPTTAPGSAGPAGRAGQRETQSLDFFGQRPAPLPHPTRASPGGYTWPGYLPPRLSLNSGVSFSQEKKPRSHQTLKGGCGPGRMRPPKPRTSHQRVKLLAAGIVTRGKEGGEGRPFPCDRLVSILAGGRIWARHVFGAQMPRKGWDPSLGTTRSLPQTSLLA